MVNGLTLIITHTDRERTARNRPLIAPILGVPVLEVIALVGPSGTGKSHRASLVARDNGVELIIDDGLLIEGSGLKIAGGKSAKREPSLVAAIRCALFTDDDHRQEARRLIHEELKPARVLILGTSRNMTDRIAEALGLDRPGRHISIEEIASPQEIRRARRIRREYGKHVIPAPTFEVKKTFSGYLIDPLRFFRRKNENEHPELIEKSVVRPTYSSLGRFFIADTVVAAIAQRAAEEVPGISKVISTVVETDPDGVEVTLEVSVKYGVPLMPIMLEAQSHVKERIEYMSALNVTETNLEARRLSLD